VIMNQAMFGVNTAAVADGGLTLEVVEPCIQA